EHGAVAAVGIDISERMLRKAKEINQVDGIEYKHIALEDVRFSPEIFDLVFSSLTFHYIEAYDVLVHNVYQWLKPGGRFVFSLEHPVFTAQGRQEWIYDQTGNKLHWPVDHYFDQGPRNTSFLGEEEIGRAHV